MNRYSYRAVNEIGTYVSGKMAAENVAELTSMLRSTKLELISFKLEKTRRSSVIVRVKTRDLIAMFIHLEQLDRAGVPILEAIGDIKENSETIKIRDLMSTVYESIKNGSLLSESLAKHPKVFSSVYIGLIANGEKTGRLSQAFNSIIEDLKWTSEMKRKTRKATLGPLFGIFVMCLVMAVMLGIVVPKVTGFLLVQSIALPGATKALISFSEFVQSYWWLILLSIPLTWAIFKVLRRFPEIAVEIDNIKLKVPVMGPVLVKIDSAKFCQFFAMTFKSGLGVIECLDSASLVIKNEAIKRSILVVKQQVSDGQSLAKSIALTGYFPNLVSRMFKVGEDSGNMDEALQNVKFFYDREINDSIERLVGMIQPALTFVMGGMIAWVTIAVFGPIYSTFSKIK